MNIGILVVTMPARRSIIQSIVPTKAGPFTRLVGSLDFKGQGTKHPLEAVDPIVLCDDGGRKIGVGLPPFGLHPHAGLIAISFVLEGAFSHFDNVSEANHQELNCAGDIYAVSSGRGLAHFEKSATEGANRMIQTVAKIPHDKVDWEPEISRAKEADLPVVQFDGGILRLCVGKLGTCESPVKPKALPRLVIGRIMVDPGARIALPLDEDLQHGFLYVIDGEGCIKGESSEQQINQGSGVHMFGAGHELVIENIKTDQKLDIFMAAGKPLNEPWKKLLGFNGFVIGQDEQEVEAIMARVADVGVENFSYKAMKHLN